MTERILQTQMRCYMRQLLLLLSAMLIPNAVFYIAAEIFGLSRPLLNIDYIFAAVCISFGYRRTGLGLAILFSLVDAFQILNQIYPFIRTSDLLIILHLLPNASAWHISVFLIVISSILTASFLVYYTSKRLNIKPLLLTTNILILWFMLYRIAYPYQINTAWRVLPRQLNRPYQAA